MQLPFKYLSWVLIASITGVVAFQTNTTSTDSTLSKNILENTILSSNKALDHNQQNESIFSISQPSNKLSIDHSLTNSFTETIQPTIKLSSKNSTNSNALQPHPISNDHSLGNILFTPNSIASKSLLSTNSLSDKIVSGNSVQDIVGIDGTGGPQPTPSEGIDGTGGPQPTPSEGIDGTGGPSIIAPTIESEPHEPEAEPEHNEPDSVSGLDHRFVVVNGNTYEITSETKIIIDDNDENTPSTESVSTTETINDKENTPSVENVNDIEVIGHGAIVSDEAIAGNGAIVIISGTKDNESSNIIANEIIITTQVTGPISKINRNSIIVLGQTITLHDDILFGGSATQFSDLQMGDAVNVSGFTLSNGDWSATRIERIQKKSEAGNHTKQLTGSISDLNELDKTFSVNQLIINYSHLATPPELQNGRIVDITGAISDQDTGILHAESIELAPSILDFNINKVELEGFVTKYVSHQNFKIGGVKISTDFETEFFGGYQHDLALNRKIEVEGIIKNDVVQATKIIFQTANLTSHVNRKPITSSTETFEWNDVNADAYRLLILYSENNETFYDEEFSGDITSATVSALPENSSFFSVFLYTKQKEFWSRKAYQLYGTSSIPNAELTSHKDGDTLQNSTETFTWNHIPDAEAYRLKVFDYSTNAIYHDQVYYKPEEVIVDNLPINGAEVVTSLYILHNGWWSKKLYSLYGISTLKNATLTSHSNGQSLTDTTETFSWEDVDAEKYQLKIVVKEHNNTGTYYRTIYTSEPITTTSVTVDNLPISGAEIIVRLETEHKLLEDTKNGSNTSAGIEEYTFTSVKLNTISNAELNSHSDKDVLSSNRETFTWNVGMGAEAYHLKLEGADIYYHKEFAKTYNPSTTTQEISDLPRNGASIILTLSTKHTDDHWVHKKYHLKGVNELPNAKIISHTSYQTINTPTFTVEWEDVQADGYVLVIQDFSQKSHPRIYQQEFDSDTTSVVIEDFPNNSILALGVSTKHGKWWNHTTIKLVTDIP